METQIDTFFDQLSPAYQARLLQRVKRSNALIQQHGIKFYKDAGELLTGYGYGEFYDWDLYFENLYLSYFGVSKFCRTNLEAFLDQQHPDGFVERTLNIVHHRPTDHFKPFLAQTALLGSKQTGSYKWLIGRYYQRLKKYVDHWTWFKDHDKNGLSVWQGAGHSGMDNQWSRCGEDDAQNVEGVDLNCYIYMELKAMAEISAAIGLVDEQKDFQQRAEQLARNINEQLWDENDGFYYDRNEQTGHWVKVQSVAAFIPLWAGIVPADRAKRLIEEHLLDENRFWLNYPVATYAKTEPDYYQSIEGIECNWRGPAWIPTNYMIMHGLMDYGYWEEARQLAERSFSMAIEEEETREYYNAETGNGEGLNPFWGWSCLAYFMPLEFDLRYNPSSIQTEKILPIGEQHYKVSFEIL